MNIGAGVQSSTMALMAAHGEITPRPHCAIFADTGAEPKAVYDWLDWLETVVSNPIRVEYPFKVTRVSYGNLRTDIGKQRPTGKFKKMPIPAFIKLKDDGNWRKGGLLRRQCTTDYKIRPLVREVRKILGIFGKRTPEGILATQWIGISTDEAVRMKESRESFIQHRWPLIEKGMNRRDCIRWMQKHYNVTPPRSACTFCPFHSNDEWRNLRDNDREAFDDAVVVDRLIRTMWAGQDKEAEFYLHKSYEPLETAQLDGDPDQLDMFGNECEGMCGV